MKTILMFLLTLVPFSAFSQVPRYNVTMTPADYQLLYSRDIFSDSLRPATLAVNDSLWPSSLVRFKGHSTRYYSKKSFRVRVPTAHLYHAQRDLNFNSMYTDKSFLRERLAWGLFADMNDMAPIAEHATLSVNGQSGLYLGIDKFDKYFFLRRGRIVAPVYEADDTYDNADMSEQPDSLLKRYYSKVIGSATDYSDLSALLHAINTAPDSSFADTLDRYFDMPSVLNWFTGNIVMMMGDSYSKNYALYRDTSRVTAQWVVIPWDYDISFGRSGDLAIPYPASLLNDRFAYTFPPLSGPSSVLKDRFLATPGLKERLRLRLDTVLQTVFTEARMLPRIDSLAAYVAAEAKNDPGKWGTDQDFRDHVDALKYYVIARRNYLLKTFIDAPSGAYNDVTLPVSQTGVPYHFVTFDGRQIATLWFANMSGLDSIRIIAHPDSAPPSLPPASAARSIRRWLEIQTYPANASFTARLQWMYADASTNATEVGTGVQDERFLRGFVFDGVTRRALPGVLNPIANIVTIDSVTEAECGAGRHFGLALSETYAQQWFRAPLDNWQRWYDVRFWDHQNGWVIGDHGTLLKTTDGGSTWVEKAIGFNTIFSSLAVLSSQTLWAAGQSGALYQSTDGGETWARHDLGVTAALRAIAFVGPFAGYVAGDGIILRTSDGGGTWSTMVTDSTQSFECLARYGYDMLVAGSSLRLSIYTTTDGGGTWSAGPAEVTGAIHAVVLGDSLAAWAAGDSGRVFYRPSASAPWQAVPMPGTSAVRRLFFLRANHIYAAGDAGSIWYSTDAGSHWYSQYSADTHDLFGIDFTDSTHGFAVGSGGTILTTSQPGTLSGVSPSAADLPSSHGLSQNYPNPFNPETRIEFQIAERGAVTLKIYDILGREVTALVNEPKEAGRYAVRWNAANLPSGVYFYRLQTGAFVETKKLILLK